MLAFQHQDSRQTLAQGLEEYYSANPGLLKPTAISAQAQEFFACHDAAHVVFGCGTSLEDEAAVKLASVFGTTAGVAVLKGYALHESREIIRQLPAAEILRSLGRSLLAVPRTLHACARQRRRWPWDDFRQYMDTSLQELRREFGIRVPAAARTR